MCIEKSVLHLKCSIEQTNNNLKCIRMIVYSWIMISHVEGVELSSLSFDAAWWAFFVNHVLQVFHYRFKIRSKKWVGIQNWATNVIKWTFTFFQNVNRKTSHTLAWELSVLTVWRVYVLVEEWKHMLILDTEILFLRWLGSGCYLYLLTDCTVFLICSSVLSLLSHLGLTDSKMSVES